MRKILPYILIPAIGLGAFYTVIQYKRAQALNAEPLAGYDRNENGIRDDIDPMITYIGMTNPAVAKAYVQLVSAMQKQILEANSKEKSLMNFKAYQRGVDCVFSFDPQQKISGEIIKRINDRLLNNDARRAAQVKYSEHLQGVEVVDTPWQKRSEKCDFDRSAEVVTQ